MRILFDNLIFNATLSADTVDANYPITNLQNDSLKKIYKATQASAVITATLSEDSSINSVYIGYTNAAGAVLAMYNSSGTLLGTKTITVTRGGLSFTSVSDVSYVTLTLSGSDIIYLGGFGLGYNFTMPNPVNDLILKPIDNSVVNYSLDGQLYQNKVDLLFYIEPTYSFESVDTYNEILLKFSDLEHPAWVEPYEENTGIINPMWCKITMGDDPTQTWGWYSWTHTYREVR